MDSNRPVRVFWGEIAPSDHIAQFYDDDESFLTILSGFIAEGLRKDESTIVIATPEHLSSLAKRLTANGIDLAKALQEDRYISMDAQVTLSSFMDGSWPNDRLFAEVITSLLQRASKNGRKVRAFGEMVALLWAQGHCAATVRLEHLWNEFCRDYGFCLLCSYPKAGFTKAPVESVAEICSHHSRFFGFDSGWPAPRDEAA
jgi:hypothetical protein